jgi:hypothetical protein
VLWSAEEDAALAQPALPRAHKPQQIRELLLAHREQRGEDILDPKVTTVSTMLRSMVEKRLLREVRLLPNGTMLVYSPGGGLLRGNRSPHTAYQTAFPPEVVLGPFLADIVQLFPAQRKKYVLTVLFELLSTSDRQEAMQLLSTMQEQTGAAR